jgi:hypothetical protein
LAAIAALAGAIAAVLAAIVSAVVAKFVVTPFLGARDRQDREVDWRKHALERKLRTRAPTDTDPLRPSILDFLANYRDLQELGVKSPKDLYETIRTKRVNAAPGREATSGSRLATPPQDEDKIAGTSRKSSSLISGPFRR